MYPGSGMGKQSGSGSGMNHPDHFSKSLETIFWVKILKFFDADPGWKKFGSWIRVKHTGSATLEIRIFELMRAFPPPEFLDLPVLALGQTGGLLFLLLENVLGPPLPRLHILRLLVAPVLLHHLLVIQLSKHPQTEPVKPFSVNINPHLYFTVYILLYKQFFTI
jgi:hypothetical protein